MWEEGKAAPIPPRSCVTMGWTEQTAADLLRLPAAVLRVLRRSDKAAGSRAEFADESGGAHPRPHAKAGCGQQLTRGAAYKAVRSSLTGRQWTALGALAIVGAWTGASVAFAYLYNFIPYQPFNNPGDIPVLPSTCDGNTSCIFALGGAIASHKMFLPAVEAFNGSAWGSEQRLPASCPDFKPNKPNPDCGSAGTYGEGVTSHAVVFNNRIYVIGHDRFGAMYSFSGNKEVIVDKLGKIVKEAYWIEEPNLNKRREGFAVAVFRGRIYAIGGRTTCEVQSLAENPDSRCTQDGHLTRTDQATQDRSVTVESIDPSKESSWRIDCEGDGDLCTKQERSGACAAVHEDKLFLIGGNDGSLVEFFDGGFLVAHVHTHSLAL